jgi:hypothetical protein
MASTASEDDRSQMLSTPRDLRKREVLCKQEIMRGILVSSRTIVAKESLTYIMEINFKDVEEYEQVNTKF